MTDPIYIVWIGRIVLSPFNLYTYFSSSFKVYAHHNLNLAQITDSLGDKVEKFSGKKAGSVLEFSSFLHHVFQNISHHGCQTSELCSKELTELTELNTVETIYAVFFKDFSH